MKQSYRLSIDSVDSEKYGFSYYFYKLLNTFVRAFVQTICCVGLTYKSKTRAITDSCCQRIKAPFCRRWRADRSRELARLWRCGRNSWLVPNCRSCLNNRIRSKHKVAVQQKLCCPICCRRFWDQVRKISIWNSCLNSSCLKLKRDDCAGQKA